MRAIRTFILRLLSEPAPVESQPDLRGQLMNVKQQETFSFRDEHELVALLQRFARESTEAQNDSSS